MRNKRKKPYFSCHTPSSVAKRRHPLPDYAPSPAADDGGEKQTSRPALPSVVVVKDLPLDCSVLDLKSRFETYGAITRIRIDRGGLGYITYLSKESADGAIAAGLDPSCAITINAKKVQVLRATDPLAVWREGIGNKNRGPISKIVLPEVPLSRHGRCKKLASAVLNPKTNGGSSANSALELLFRGGDIVAYDDIL